MSTEPITDAELEDLIARSEHRPGADGWDQRSALRLGLALRAARIERASLGFQLQLSDAALRTACNNFAAERAAFQALSEGCKRVEAERDAARAANATLRAMLDTAETILSRPLLAALVDDPSWRDGVWPHLRAMRSIAEDVRKLIPKQDSPRLG